jgi:hypothetical protein
LKPGELQTKGELTILAVRDGPFPAVLSERSFVVLRYDKRGMGENGTILDLEICDKY